MWNKESESVCDQYNVPDSFKDLALSWQLTVNSFMLTFFYPIPPLHSCWTANIFKLHLTLWTWQRGHAKTQQSHCESVPDRGLYTWQSLTLPSLLNKLLLAQLSFFSEMTLPLTQISLLLKEQPVLASRRASVWKEEVFQTLIQGLLELLPFGQALARSFTLSVSFSGFLPLFCGATNTNWEWQQMLLVLIN